MTNAMSVTYKEAGVDQERKDAVIDRILRMMRRTYDPGVLDLPWGFAGFYSLKSSTLFERDYKHPVLVSGADGVGTKLKIASALDRHDTVGIDLVAMNVNDLVVTGATPLFFLDYIAIGKADERKLLGIVEGIVEGCRQAGCALLGGETAEMPGMYADGEYDLAGFCVGIVEKSRILDGRAVKPGDDVIGLASSGLHSNGYSLARKIVFEKKGQDLDRLIPELGGTLGDELLKPTRIYARVIRDLLRRYRVKKAIKAMANITGGGMVENIPRVLPKHCAVEIRGGSWTVPPIFSLLQRWGGVSDPEMFRVFNMGVGMVLISDPYFTSAIRKGLERSGEKAWVIGKVVRGTREVSFVS